MQDAAIATYKFICRLLGNVRTYALTFPLFNSKTSFRADVFKD